MSLLMYASRNSSNCRAGDVRNDERLSIFANLDISSDANALNVRDFRDGVVMLAHRCKRAPK